MYCFFIDYLLLMVNKYFINDIHIHEICFCFKYLRVMIASFVILVFLYFKK